MMMSSSTLILKHVSLLSQVSLENSAIQSDSHPHRSTSIELTNIVSSNELQLPVH